MCRKFYSFDVQNGLFVALYPPFSYCAILRAESLVYGLGDFIGFYWRLHGVNCRSLLVTQAIPMQSQLEITLLLRGMESSIAIRLLVDPSRLNPYLTWYGYHNSQ